MLGKRKDSFIEEAGNPGEEVDSCPKEQTPDSPGFTQKLYWKRRRGYILRRGLWGMLSAHGHSSDWLVVRYSGVNSMNLLVPTSLESTCL